MRRLRFLAPVLGLTLLLGACGSDDSPKAEADPAPSGAASASPSGSPSASASDVADPSASRVPTKAPAGETAEEFIKRWNVTETAMENSGESEVFRAMTKDCRPCAETADSVDRYYSAGGYIRSQGRDIVSFKKLPTKSGFAAYMVTFDIGPTTYRKRAGGPVQKIEGGRFVYQFEMRQASEWRLLDVSAVVS